MNLYFLTLDDGALVSMNFYCLTLDDGALVSMSYKKTSYKLAEQTFISVPVSNSDPQTGCPH